MVVPYRVAEKFMKDYKAKDKGIINGRRVWLLGGTIVINLIPNQDVHWDHFETIALDQVGLNWWELDHWLGENTNDIL